VQDNTARFSDQEIHLNVSAHPLPLERGDTLYVIITAENTNNRTVVKHFANGCIYGFSLWSNEGEVVAPPPRVCTMDAPTIRYAPGEVVEVEYYWVWDDPGIEPGAYLLVGGFGPRGEYESAPPVEVRLE
jgi:hypothetical protein